MNYEELGKLVVKMPNFKFPEFFVKKGVIRFIDSTRLATTSVNNFEVTEYGWSIIKGEKYRPIVDDTFLEEYMFLFSKDNLQGICKKSYSPSNKVKTKLEAFMKRYKTSKIEILEAVQYYHNNAQDLRYTLDAQYFIDKNGGSLLLDTIHEMRKGIFSTQDKLLI